MIEEIKTDNNCIVKAFENNPISIIEENNDDKKIYYFKASDIGKALKLTNIAVSIQHYDEDERVIRKAYDTSNREQDTIFLTSRGVYRLLYSSKKEIAKKFRKWASDILDDIIFNQSKGLQRQLEEREEQLQELLYQQDQNELEKEILLEKTLLGQFPQNTQCIYYGKIDNKDMVGGTLVKFGMSNNLQERVKS
jgi:prophage antirepressor-like protein